MIGDDGEKFYPWKTHSECMPKKMDMQAMNERLKEKLIDITIALLNDGAEIEDIISVCKFTEKEWLHMKKETKENEALNNTGRR